jgi:cytochrome c oxidase subunit III
VSDLPAPRDIDARGLPTYAFGHRSLMWWGTFGMILIESTVFVLAIVAYFYLREHTNPWPPPGTAPPALIYGTLNLIVLFASAIPNQWTKHVAEREDLKAVRIGLVICLAFGVALLIVRGLEFIALNTRWYESAYGSIVFALMLLHTIHLVTDFIDSVVLTALMFTDKVTGRRFVDVSENALYWWFVVGSWPFVYATVYLAPRL